MTIKIKTKELDYEFTDGTNEIHLSVYPEEGLYTLQKREGGMDFDFCGADPVKSKSLLTLMLSATEYAKNVIEGNRTWENVTDGITSTITTEVKIDAVLPKPVTIQAAEISSNAYGQSKDDCDTPYSHSERNDLLI